MLSDFGFRPLQSLLASVGGGCCFLFLLEFVHHQIQTWKAFGFLQVISDGVLVVLPCFGWIYGVFLVSLLCFLMRVTGEGGLLIRKTDAFGQWICVL